MIVSKKNTTFVRENKGPAEYWFIISTPVPLP